MSTTASRNGVVKILATAILALAVGGGGGWALKTNGGTPSSVGQRVARLEAQVESLQAASLRIEGKLDRLLAHAK